MTTKVQHQEVLTHEYAVVGLIVAGSLLLLPLLAAVGFAFQFVFVAVGPLLLLLALIRAFTTPAEPVVDFAKGVAVPSNVRFSRMHTWLRSERRGVLTAGLDDFGQRMLGPVLNVECASVGQVVAEGEVIAVLWHGGRRTPVRAPISARVLRANPRVALQPSLINSAPYDAGWLVELEPSGAKWRSGLLAKGPAVRWMRTEVELLSMAVEVESGDGTLPAGALSAVDDKAWPKLTQAFLE